MRHSPLLLTSRTHQYTNHLLIAAFIALGASPAFAAEATTAPDNVGPQELIQTFEALSGIHKGMRRGHAKGFCAKGVFTGADGANKYSSSPIFDGKTHPVTVRFSLGGGNPAASDSARGPRGMALQIKLPDGQLHNMAMLSTPMFPAKNPTVFNGLLKTFIPDPATGKPDPAKTAAYRAANPDTQAQPAWLASHNPSWSYGSTSYYGIHTFFFTGSDTQRHKVRWQFTPVAGEKLLSDSELATAGTDFLMDNLRQQLKQGAVSWDMAISFGEASDSEIDPSQTWPDNRTKIKMARLDITAADIADKDCDGVNFDPNRVTAGVAPSADPVLQMRSAAYAISFGKRLSGQ
mgnify:CR=1 FL=1